MKKRLTLLLIICTILSCTKKENDILDNQYGTPTTLKKENVLISIDDETLSSYQVFTTYNDKKDDYIFGYNSKLHTIDLIEVGDTLISHVQLQEEGENGILKQVSGIFMHNMDSIWVYSQNNLYLTDTLGCVKKKTVLPFPAGGFIVIDTNFSIATNRIFYHPERETVFYLTATPTNESADYKVYEYNLKSNNFQSYDLAGGALEKKAGKNYGWKQFPNVTYTLDNIVYNFPISSNIYSIDIKTKKGVAHGGRSNFTSNCVSELVMPYDFQMANKHLLENVHFFELQYDCRRNVYYRLHLGNVEYANKQDFYEIYNDKNIYVTVFNKDFEVINETDLGTGTYDYFNYWGVIGNGFFIAKNMIESDEENMLQFELLSIK